VNQINSIDSVYILIIIVLLSVIGYLITHPNKIIDFNAYIYNILATYIISADKPAVKLTIESSLNKISNDMNREIEGILPYGIEIEWVRNTDRETFIRNNKIVIRMEYHQNNTRNIVNATLRYFEEGLLKNIKEIIDLKISKSIDFVTAKKTLRETKKYDSLQFLVENVINPIENEDEEIRYYLNSMSKLYEAGFFSRIFLNELKNINQMLYVDKIYDNLNEDIIIFLEKLNEIAHKKRGVDIDTHVITNYLKISFVYIARLETLKYGIKPYTNYILSEIDEGYENFYIIARGKINIQVAELVSNKLISDKILNKKIEHRYKTTYEGRNYDLICINLIKGDSN